MSKATRNRTRAAQERIAAQREAARRAERRRVMLISGGSIVAVLAIVVGLVFFALNRKQAGSGHLPASVASQITGVPATTLASVGTGTSASASSVYLKAITDSPLTSGGKPEMLFIGAEYCPYCAAMRWSMAVALSRFGTFGPFKGIHSSATDVYPNTPTLTFYKQQYTSSYLTFKPIENLTVHKTPLQPVGKADQALWTKYDSSPQGVGYPFIDFGGKVILTGPLYVPTVLRGLTWSQIAGQLSNPNSTVGKNIDGAANYITAAICKMTSNAPASVCQAGPIPTLEAKL